jgi:hypothetical protein
MAESNAAPKSKAMFWAGWVLSILPCGLLLFCAAGKFAGGKDLGDGFAHLGWPIGLAITLGIIELVATIVYLVPPTAVLGAILLTGYMGGAMATHLRIEEPVFVQFGVGVVLWLGLYLREPRLRALIPFRTVR